MISSYLPVSPIWPDGAFPVLQFPEAAPALISGAGVEFRAISDPSALFSVCEPFGSAENTPDGIHEPGMKTGSLVTSFVNAYIL